MLMLERAVLFAHKVRHWQHLLPRMQTCRMHSHGVQLALLPPPPHVSAVPARSASVVPSLRGYASTVALHQQSACAASSLQPPLRLRLVRPKAVLPATAAPLATSVALHAIVSNAFSHGVQLALLPPSLRLTAVCQHTVRQ